MTRGWTAWLAVGLWALLVLGLGSEPFSEASTSRFLGPVLHWLLPRLSADALADLEHAIRKTAHVVEYTLLAVLAYRALHLSAALGAGVKLLLAIALVGAVASLDEWHQSGEPSRTGQAADVLLDVSGSLVGLGVALALRRHAHLRWLPDRSDA
jgi:VanZ family protein